MAAKTTKKAASTGTPPAMQELPLVSISELNFAEYNPRSMTEEDMSALTRSIQEFGLVEPVVCNKDNTVIGGHQRLRACKRLGIENIPVLYVDLPKTREKTLNLALNRIHGSWDMQKLSAVIAEIKMNDLEALDLTGFNKYELQDLEPLASTDLQRPDDQSLIDDFKQPETGKTPKDQNWFYIEYYGDNERWEKLTAALQEVLKNQHELDNDKFYEMVIAWQKQKQSEEVLAK